MSNIQHFGVTSKGEDVAVITLRKGDISCKILSFGATIQSLTVPDRKGQPLDIVLGYDSISEYETQDAYLGAVVGRYANRIAKGKFSLNGKEYSLAINNGPNHLHGGIVGFSYKVWTIEDAGEDFVKLSLESADGEEAYPGNMKITVTYTLDNNSLSIRYEAVSDADTVCNLTNHSYFNAEFYTPTDADSIPYGELAPVAGTPMDFREFTKLGERINSDFIQLIQGNGYDHNYVVDGEVGQLRPAATARCAESGICMQLETTQPGVQLYTANYINEGRPGKGGAAYGPRHAFSQQAQFPQCSA